MYIYVYTDTMYIDLIMGARATHLVELPVPHSRLQHPSSLRGDGVVVLQLHDTAEAIQHETPNVSTRPPWLHKPPQTLPSPQLQASMLSHHIQTHFIHHDMVRNMGKGRFMDAYLCDAT